jgi:hypothetical protein
MNEQKLGKRQVIDNRSFPKPEAHGRREPMIKYGVIDNRGLPAGSPVKPIQHNSFKCPECGGVAQVKRTITEEESQITIRHCECTNRECKAWNKKDEHGLRFKG